MIIKFFKFIYRIINLIILDRAEKNFIKHNKILFNYPQNKEDQILIEVHDIQPNYISISYLSKALSKIYNAKLIGYNIHVQLNLFEKLKYLLRNLKIKKIYKSFGVNKFIIPDKKKNNILAYKLKNKLEKKINSKFDLINLIIDNVWFGDLIYDHYLATYKVPTVNIKSSEFKKILFEFSILYFEWKDILSKKNIKALVISHACYFMGLPARLAISMNIPVYQANLQTIYFLSKKNIFPSCEYHTYKKDFEKLDFKTKKNGIAKSRQRLKLIFDGKTDVDQPYIKHSAYAQKKFISRVLDNRSSIKILIASHSFYDSPHGFGKTLFADFYEWLEFIGELSNKTKYEWYIKTHPAIDILDQNTINDFINRYKKIILIPNTVSHLQLFEEGINIVLTVYGSIGLEYAAKNITVINASLNNPHISYDFNIHPKSIDEFRDIILNLNKYVNKKIVLEDVYKCYYMKYLYNDYNIFFRDFLTIMKKMGGYNSLFSSKIYDYWINYNKKTIQNKIETNLTKFVLSKKYKIKSNWS